MTTDTLTAALDYAARGWRVIPIIPGQKRPRGHEWQLRATTDAGTLTTWWGQGEDGIGIATGPASGIFVLDVDVAGDKRGDETLAELEALYGQLPDTLEVRTGSGGRHIYFRWPDGHDIRNDASNRLGPGLDIRGDGGQVVAPPTIHPNGDRYTWDLGCDNVADAPEWLLQLLTEDPWATTANPNKSTSADATHATITAPTAATPPKHSASPPHGPSATTANATSEPTPAEHYNGLTTWTELLLADHWTLDHTDRSGEQHWVRPGKDGRDGTSATVGYKGQDVLIVFTTSLPWLPSGPYSRFGYYAARHHNSDRSAAARRIRQDKGPDTEHPPRPQPEPSATDEPDDPFHIIDWPTFWTRDEAGPDWLIEPIIARGRGHALYAAAKTGKSLLMLAAVAAAATGRAFLLSPARPPVHILYLDYEMTADDVRERLEGFGYGPDDDLSRLHYALLPSIPPLDTELGADQVVTLALHVNATHVVIDTTSRAISGEENSADTFRAFYRLTGLRLKGAGIGYHRLDHSGKDADRGQRGSSAKNDDVDIVQQLVPRDSGAFTLRATHRRMMWVPESVDISKDESADMLTYTTDQPIQPDGTYHIVKWLDDNQAPVDISRRRARELLKASTLKVRNDALGAALKLRRNDMKWAEGVVPDSGDHPPTQSGPRFRGPLGTTPHKSWSEAGTTAGTTGDHYPQAEWSPVPHVVGTGPQPTFREVTAKGENEPEQAPTITTIDPF